MSRMIRLPFPFRALAGGTHEVPAEGATAAELLASLAGAHPGLRRHLFTDAGQPRGYVHLYADGHEVMRPDQQIPAGAAIELVPAVAGGRRAGAEDCISGGNFLH